MLILVARGKGNKQRLVPLSRPLLEELRAWWRTHRNPVWLFPGIKPDRPLNVSPVQKACQILRARLAPVAATPAALALCVARGAEVVHDLCPFMVMPGASFPHRAHGFLRRHFGHPAHARA